MTIPTKYLPRSCVWELTLACNAHCIHCGSSAGKRREDELTTEEAIKLIEELADLGCSSITLSGGEPLLRDDWTDLALRITDSGMRLEMITNGLLIAEQADTIAKARFFAVTVSLDGPSDIHDKLRGTKGGFVKLLEGAKALIKRGVLIGAATQVNRINLNSLQEIHEILVENGFKGWQVQLTMPLGQASGRDDLCIKPEDLLILESALIEIKRRSALFIQAADNVGYMSSHEPALRGGKIGQESFYRGCTAGMGGVGITSDGSVKGCLSMPDNFVEGNIRDRSLKEIWNDQKAFAYNRAFSKSELTPPCSSCDFANICRAGCKSFAFATNGKVTCNSYCLHNLKNDKNTES